MSELIELVVAIQVEAVTLASHIVSLVESVIGPVVGTGLVGWPSYWLSSLQSRN